MHYAISGHTAVELIYERANANKEHYEKFKVKQDMQYISSMDEMYQRYLKENNNK